MQLIMNINSNDLINLKPLKLLHTSCLLADQELWLSFERQLHNCNIVYYLTLVFLKEWAPPSVREVMRNKSHFTILNFSIENSV